MRTTTDFFTLFCSALSRFAWLLCCFLLVAQPASAAKPDEAITVQSAELKPTEENWVLNAAFNVKLNRTQEEALKKGIALYFVTEVEVQRQRSWWFNDDIAATSRIGRLSYSPLTRRYQVETVEAFKAYDTLAEALTELGSMENWIITAKKTLKQGNSYTAAIRMRLDQGLLSKPLQINAFATGKWEVEGDWYEWEVTP